MAYIKSDSTLITADSTNYTADNISSRYFVGGSGAKNWNDTANWSLESGGASGASVPTANEDAIFDAASLSGPCTLTVDAYFNCHHLNMTGLDAALTLSSSVFDVYIYGSLTLPPTNLTWTFTGTAYVYFKATTAGNTITSGAVTRNYNFVIFNGVGGGWTLQDNFLGNINSVEIFLYNGELDTNSKNITSNTFSIGAGTKTLTLGSSSITTVAWGYYGINTTGLTFNSDTSTITHTGSETFVGGSLTYYNIVITNEYQYSLTGSNTFHNLTKNASYNLRLSANQTITNILTLIGYSASQYRMLIYSDTLGTARTITSANNSITNVDFRDITGAGAGSWDFSAAEIGDCGGNSGITFRTGENRYYKATSTATHYFDELKWWSATNGGGVSKGMPLEQDTAILDSASTSGSMTFTIRNPRIGSIDMSGVDDAVTLVYSNNIEVYGNYILGNNITPSGNQWTLLYGRDNFNFNAYGKSLYAVQFWAYNGTYINQANFTVTRGNGAVFGMYAPGIFDFNDYDITINGQLYNGKTGAKLYFGNGIINIRYVYVDYIVEYNDGTFYPECSTIKLTNLSASGEMSFSYYNGSYNNTWNNLWFESTTGGTYKMKGNNTFNNIKIDSGVTVKFTAGTTTTFSSLTAIGTVGNPITITSVTAVQHTLSYTGASRVECNYLTLSYSKANQINKFFAGKNSTNGGNNTNWLWGEYSICLVDIATAYGSVFSHKAVRPLSYSPSLLASKGELLSNNYQVAAKAIASLIENKGELFSQVGVVIKNAFASIIEGNGYVFDVSFIKHWLIEASLIEGKAEIYDAAFITGLVAAIGQLASAAEAFNAQAVNSANYQATLLTAAGALLTLAIASGRFELIAGTSEFKKLVTALSEFTPIYENDFEFIE